ncbi:MAG: alpha/beta fold hydrolase [Chloroflexi bacterium]|nr:alpha/beta fold hydrolase [Chloroflexota bacterium]
MAPIMRGAEPFTFAGGPLGCLLVHGFTGTCNEMRWLGAQLAAEGYTVLAPLLAGHGTTPQDMNTTRWPDWYASALDGYRQLRAECGQVFVLGLSMGGALALHLAALEAVDGLVVMATPLHVRDWRLTLFRPFQRFIPYWPVGSGDTAADLEHLQYSHMPTACVMSMLELFRRVERELPRVAAPSLLIGSRLDPLAPPREIWFIYDRLPPIQVGGLPAAHKEMVMLERGGHVVCDDVERETLWAHARRFIARRVRVGAGLAPALTRASGA